MVIIIDGAPEMILAKSVQIDPCMVRVRGDPQARFLAGCCSRHGAYQTLQAAWSVSIPSSWSPHLDALSLAVEHAHASATLGARAALDAIFHSVRRST